MTFGYDAKELLISRLNDIMGLAFRGLSQSINVNATVLSRDQHRSEVRLDVNGEKARVVFFDLESEVGLRSANREIVISSKLFGTKLLPDIKGFADDRSFLAFELVEGDALVDLLNENTVGTFSRAMGAWARGFSEASVAEPCEGNWHEYLSEYEAFHDSEELGKHVDYLRTLTFSEKRIAQNQVRLDRYISTNDGKLMALDMANAALKPPRWDLLLMARELVQIFSGHIDVIAFALSEGWHGETASAEYRSTTYLIKLFAVQSTLKPLKKNKGKLARALDDYNSRRDRKVTKAFLTPYLQNALTDLQDAERAAFSAHLEAEVKKVAKGEIDASTKLPSLPETNTATQFLRSMCATCKGFCCKPGREKNAFINASEIAVTADQKYKGNSKAAVEYYLYALPEKHIKGSCLYHTAVGCALPRDARSSVCNTYYCQPAKTVFETLNRCRNTQEVLFLARDGLSADGYTARIDPKTNNVLSESFKLDK